MHFGIYISTNLSNATCRRCVDFGYFLIFAPDKNDIGNCCCIASNIFALQLCSACTNCDEMHFSICLKIHSNVSTTPWHWVLLVACTNRGTRFSDIVIMVAFTPLPLDSSLFIFSVHPYRMNRMPFFHTLEWHNRFEKNQHECKTFNSKSRMYYLVQVYMTFESKYAEMNQNESKWNRF